MGQTSPEQQHVCGYFDSGNCLYGSGEFRQLFSAINLRREIGRRIGQLEASQVKGGHSKHHDEIYKLKQEANRMTVEIDAKKQALKKSKPSFANYRDTGYTCKAEKIIFSGDTTKKGIQDQQNCSRFYSSATPSPKIDQIF